MTPEDREEKWNKFIDKNRKKLTDSLRIDVEVITHLDSNNVLAQNQLQFIVSNTLRKTLRISLVV